MTLAASRSRAGLVYPGALPSLTFDLSRTIAEIAAPTGSATGVGFTGFWHASCETSQPEAPMTANLFPIALLICALHASSAAAEDRELAPYEPAQGIYLGAFVEQDQQVNGSIADFEQRWARSMPST